jgi:hypothetical protein
MSVVHSARYFARVSADVGDTFSLRAFLKAMHGDYKVLDRNTLLVSANTPGRAYIVHRNGEWSPWICTCPAGRHGRQCWHAALAEAWAEENGNISI